MALLIGIQAITAIDDHTLPADREGFEILRKNYQETPAKPVRPALKSSFPSLMRRTVP